MLKFIKQKYMAAFIVLLIWSQIAFAQANSAAKKAWQPKRINKCI